MRKILLATAALALLAGAPMLASAAEPAPAATPQPAPGSMLQRLFNHPADARRQTPAYGDPFDAGQRRPDQVILAPVGP